MPIVIEDKQSLEVLRSVDPNFSGLIKTDEDYLKAVFYFRAAGLREDIKSNPKYKVYEHLFDDQKSVDSFFKCVHADGQRVDEMLALDEKYIPLSTAFMFVQNDVLYAKYEDEGSNNNKAVQNMSKINVLKPYLDSEIFKETYNAYTYEDESAVAVLQKVRERLAQKQRAAANQAQGPKKSFEKNSYMPFRNSIDPGRLS